MASSVLNSNFQTVENTVHPSMKPLVNYHGRIVKTFAQLPSDGKFFEVLKRIILVAVAPFAYLVLGLIGILGYPLTQVAISKKNNTSVASGVFFANEEKGKETAGKSSIRGLEKNPSQEFRTHYSSEIVKGLYTRLKHSKSNSEKKHLYLKIAKEEIVQRNNKGASLALNELTKILDAREDTYVNEYCEIARLRIELEPAIVPYELEQAAQLEEKERGKYTINETPPLYISHYIMDLAKCYLLLNDKVKVNQQVETMKTFADKFKNRNPDAYVHVFVTLAKFHIESNNIADAAYIINGIVIPEINKKFTNIDMRISIEHCVQLAKAFIENGHINAPVPALISAAEKRFKPCEEGTGYEVEYLRELINNVKNQLR